jgi:hypothetical protein
MQNLADNIANVTTNLAKMIKGFGDVASNPAFQAVIALLLLRAGKVDILAKLFAGGIVAGILTAPKQNISMEENRALAQKRIADRIKEAKGIKDAVTYRTQENALLKSKTEVDKLKDKFDLERIGLMAALNSATDEETKLRLKAQLALLDQNEVLAKKYNAELDAARASNTLADSLNNSANALTSRFLPAVLDAAGNLTARGNRVLPSVEDSYGSMPSTSSSSGGGGSAGGGTTNVYVQPQGSILTNQDLEQTVQEVMLSLYRQGRNTVPAGAL